MPHQVNGSQRVGGGHVWPCPLDSLDGKLGLAHVVLAGCQSILKSLPDDVLKVRVHGGMKARISAKRKPRRSGALYQGELTSYNDFLAERRALMAAVI